MVRIKVLVCYIESKTVTKKYKVTIFCEPEEVEQFARELWPEASYFLFP